MPPRVQEALGELVGTANEGLLALSVGVGLGVLAELPEEEVVEVVGAKGKHDPARTAVRHGHEAGEVTLGGSRVAVERPRVRSADGHSEVPLRTYRHFADRDPLTRLVLEQMLAGVSTRRFERTREPVGAEVEALARSTSRSASRASSSRAWDARSCGGHEEFAQSRGSQKSKGRAVSYRQGRAAFPERVMVGSRVRAYCAAPTVLGRREG